MNAIASLCVRGPRYIAQDIILSPYVEIVDRTQYINILTKPIDGGGDISALESRLIELPCSFLTL